LGSPVIVADLPGFKDQVGDAGQLTDPYDHEVLASKLLKLLNNPIYRAEMISKGKNRADLFSDKERLDTLKLIFTQFEKKQSLWKFD